MSALPALHHEQTVISDSYGRAQGSCMSLGTRAICSMLSLKSHHPNLGVNAFGVPKIIAIWKRPSVHRYVLGIFC